ncbi:MAG TPA: PAS domain-containing protein, partial [Methanomassiliicoccaceae archaeon]|nr:PAS domain-containing protein [Methanomassiliicoccaceae archaeon]
MEGLDPFEVEEAEEQLEKEGLSQRDMMLLCDAHVRYMEDITEDEEALLEMPGHPIHTLMEEHVMILVSVKKARDSVLRILNGEGDLVDRERLIGLESFFKEAQKHFQREENVLFPYMERHGITGPPARMWAEHDVLRRKEKEIARLVERMVEGDEDPVERLACSLSQLLSLLNTHFYKENHVLFPQAINVLDALEWNEVRRHFDDVGCCSFMPHHAQVGFRTMVPTEPTVTHDGEVVLPTGRLTAEEVEMLLNALPLEITYVGEDDTVRYFSKPADRIFVRTEAVIGRKVQNCHPAKSLHLVQRIVEDFKSGARDQAEFWIDMEGKKVHIRFWPLRDRKGNYRGVVEVVQNVTGIMDLKGEKRLLDES